jgi:hypothetical protein
LLDFHQPAFGGYSPVVAALVHPFKASKRIIVDLATSRTAPDCIF